MLKPVNRYVWISLPAAPQNTTESGIVLPDDFKPTEEKYITATVEAAAEDVRFCLDPGVQIVVDKSMVEEVNVDNQLFTLVQDNYILGVLKTT